MIITMKPGSLVLQVLLPTAQLLSDYFCSTKYSTSCITDTHTSV